MSFVREAFVKIYTTSQLEVKLHSGPISSWQMALFDTERDDLVVPISVEEIKPAL